MTATDTWIEIQYYAEDRVELLKTFIHLLQHLTAHDTFARVLNCLYVQVFSRCFDDFIQALVLKVKNEIITIDE